MMTAIRTVGPAPTPASKPRRGLLAATLLAGLLSAPCEAVPVLIDDFSSGFQLVSVNAGTTFATNTTAAASAIGGSRTLDATLNSPTGNGDALVVPGGQGLAIGAASTNGSVDVGLHWTPGGIDLTSGGTNAMLVLDFILLDPGLVSPSILFDFLFTSTSGDTALLSFTVDAIPPNPTTVLVDFGTAVLSPLAGNTAFTNTAKIDATIRLSAAADFTLDSLGTAARGGRGVPDAGSTLALLSLVLSVGAAAKWLLSQQASA
jgi:hypothetical protein